MIDDDYAPRLMRMHEATAMMYKPQRVPYFGDMGVGRWRGGDATAEVLRITVKYFDTFSRAQQHFADGDKLAWVAALPRIFGEL